MMKREKVEEEISKLINMLVVLYSQCYEDLQEIPLCIEITDNLNRRHSEIRPDLADEIFFESLHSNDNGRMVLPLKTEDSIYVLLNENTLKDCLKTESITWFGTVAHEVTHAVDYHQMAKKRGDLDYAFLERGYVFPGWSEYHARKIGYSFLRMMCERMQYLPEKNKQIEEIINVEWPYFMKGYHEDYHKHGDNGTYQIYLTMQILGRYSVWNDLYPEYFNEEKLAEDFYGTSWMTDLYSFLRKHETVDLIYPCLEEFKEIIAENWKEKIICKDQ